MSAPSRTTAKTAATDAAGAVRHDWTTEEILGLFDMPFNDLLYAAQTVHRRHFDPNRIQTSTLLSIKTGGCSEDCKYCAQSVHYDTGLERERLLPVSEVKAAAERAKAGGSTRFCMGAAWRSLNDSHVERIAEMVGTVKALGMETCMTLGMITAPQAKRLKDAGLDYYNHNVDTSEEFYDEIITTRAYADRLDTLASVQAAGMKVCSGGIVGMGEARKDRAGMLKTLANLDPQPESVPINMLVPIEGTPLGHVAPLDPIEFVRTIAVARLMLPKSFVRLSAGRESMTDEMQALCFLAGANSMFTGEKLLTAPNAGVDTDQRLFRRLGIEAMAPEAGSQAAE